MKLSFLKIAACKAELFISASISRFEIVCFVSSFQAPLSRKFVNFLSFVSVTLVGLVEYLVDLPSFDAMGSFLT